MPLQYTAPHQFEPLVLGNAGDALLSTAGEVIARSKALQSVAHATTRERLRELLRAMNSYYSNRIEGQGTHPLNIERALRDDYSQKPDVAQRQRIARAYMQAEQALERVVVGGLEPLSWTFASRAHHAMYSLLAPEDRRSHAGNMLDPGALRTAAVEIGQHVPPGPEHLASFLNRYDAVYGAHVRPEQRLLAIACAHHRLAWVHPFEDGNGRAGRLVTHAALFPLTDGLWSLSRGLARKRDEYYARLAGADAPRRGDLDGRGNLSLEGLVQWCRFLLELCLDQVTFMTTLLDLDGLKERLRALVLIKGGKLKVEVALALHHLVAAGPVTRGEFKQLTGLGDRTAQGQIALLLKLRLLESDSALGPLRIGFPLDSLQYLFPDLYPEAATRVDE